MRVSCLLQFGHLIFSLFSRRVHAYLQVVFLIFLTGFFLSSAPVFLNNFLRNVQQQYANKWLKNLLRNTDLEGDMVLRVSGKTYFWLVYCVPLSQILIQREASKLPEAKLLHLIITFVLKSCFGTLLWSFLSADHLAVADIFKEIWCQNIPFMSVSKRCLKCAEAFPIPLVIHLAFWEQFINTEVAS